jgi:hypothetical protein
MSLVDFARHKFTIHTLVFATHNQLWYTSIEETDLSKSKTVTLSNITFKKIEIELIKLTDCNRTMTLKLPEDHFIWSEEPFTAPIPTINVLLQNFEKNDLTCTICSDFFDNPITLLPCHHSFCNRCIRDYCIAPACGAQRKCNKCPTCSTEIKKDLNKILVTNAGLNKVVQSYKILRKQLYDSMVELNAATETLASPIKSSLENEEQNDGNQAPVHKRPRRSQSASYKEEENEVIDLTNDVKPIISLPPLNFGILPSKLKQLKLKCKENGIDDNGKMPEELKQRLQRFQEFWNSEVSRPEQIKTRLEIIGQFNKEERAKRMSSSVVKSAFVSQQSNDEDVTDSTSGVKKRGWNEVLLHRATYNGKEYADCEDSNDFASLLGKLKRRRLEECARPLEHFIYQSDSYREKWLNFGVKGTGTPGGIVQTNVTANDIHPQSTTVAPSTAAQSVSFTVNSSVTSTTQSAPLTNNSTSQNNGIRGNIPAASNANVAAPCDVKRSDANEQHTSFSAQQAVPKPIVQNPYSRVSTVVNHNNNNIRSLPNRIPMSNMNGQMIKDNHSFGNGPKATDLLNAKQISNPYAKKQGPSSF